MLEIFLWNLVECKLKIQRKKTIAKCKLRIASLYLANLSLYLAILRKKVWIVMGQQNCEKSLNSEFISSISDFIFLLRIVRKKVWIVRWICLKWASLHFSPCFRMKMYLVLKSNGVSCISISEKNKRKVHPTHFTELGLSIKFKTKEITMTTMLMINL